MTRRRRNGILAIFTLAAVAVALLGWGRTSPAQSLRPAKKGGYAEFQSLLSKHGDKGMLLEVHLFKLQQGKGEILGKLVQSTEAMLVLKAQNQQDLYFVTWDDILWITARPN